MRILVGFLGLAMVLGCCLFSARPHPIPDWKSTPVCFAENFQLVKLRYTSPSNRIANGEVRLLTEGALASVVCSSGELTFHAYGTKGDSRLPQIQIINNSKVTKFILNEKYKSYRVCVERGSLIIVFQDDFYSPQHGDRNVFLKNLQFKSM